MINKLTLIKLGLFPPVSSRVQVAKNCFSVVNKHFSVGLSDREREKAYFSGSGGEEEKTVAIRQASWRPVFFGADFFVVF